MKKSFYTLFKIVMLPVVFLLACNYNSIAYPSGSPAGYTGSPGDGQHCQSCHGGSNATVNGWITSNIPSQGYTPGTIYNMTVTVSGTGKKGFEVSPQAVTGAQLGILAAGPSNHLVGGTKYVTQNGSGSSSATVVWNFSWTAPAAGTGNVTFYGAFTVGKTNTKLSTLMVSENAALPLTATASASPQEVCAGSMVQLDVAVTGGSGSYTYQWSSIPAGFISSVQNPVVLPATSTQYVVHVSDGSGVADSPVDVGVIQQATADAGNDTTMAYAANSVPLHGIASSFASALWMTNGTGTFSDQTSLIGDYLPSLADKNSGTVQLSLTSFPISPCFQNAVDVKIVQFDAPTGLRENSDDLMRIEVSPNPSSGKFKISISQPGIFAVTVRNINGLPVLQQRWNGTLAAENLIDLTSFPKGVYFISLMNDRFSGTAKVMIQ